MLSCVRHLLRAVGRPLKTLNYIHGTPEQTSARAPRWPYSNKIQFDPGAEAGKRFGQNRPASSGVAYTKRIPEYTQPQYFFLSRTTPVGRRDWRLFSGILVSCFVFPQRRKTVFSHDQGRTDMVTIFSPFEYIHSYAWNLPPHHLARGPHLCTMQHWLLLLVY